MLRLKPRARAARGNCVPLIAMAMVSVWLAGAPAQAEETASPASTICPICHRANDQTLPYTQKAGATLVRGATNLIFGWTELLVQPASEVQKDGDLVRGIGKGLGQSVTRTAAGLGELLTFWVPKGKDGYLSLTTTCPICLSTISPSSPSNKTPAASSPPSSNAP